jgi:predicted phage tail protein
MAKITGAMGGGSKGGSARAPVIAPDSIRSQAIVEVVEAICEGEIEGFVTVDPLESIYLDETPLKSNGTSNFNGISVDYRLGTQTQSYIPGQEEDAAATPISVGVNVTNANPVIRTISDNTTDAVRVTVKFAALYQVNSSNGDKNGVEVSLSIEVKPAGGYWHTVDLAGRGTINDKTESPYQRNFTVKLKDYGDANSYDIRVSRVSADPTSSQSSAFQWESYTKLSYAKLRYPNTVIIRSTFDSQHFSSMPSRGYHLKGRKVKVPPPSVYNPVTRQYSGADWDGTFMVAWTRCPAWIFYDLITDPRAGLGDLINPAYLDKWNLYQIAKRCDELVPDGFGGTECRYSLDLYLQDSNSAKQVVLDIASGFDAMAFWTSGGIYTTQDAPKPVSALFTPANVVGGQFQYTGSARQMRYTVAMVQWNDPTDNYRIATEYVEDIEGIARYGYREKQVAAIGCTSRGQAHRLGKRILLTSRLETDAVAFSVGLDGISCKPGDIVRIADPLRASHNRYGGRVKTGSTVSTILLDAPVTLAAGTIYKIAVIKADGSVIESTVTNGASSTDSISVSPALTDLPEVDAAFIVYSPAESGKLYRILGISENADTSNGFYSVSAVQYAPEKYAQIDSLAALPPLPDNPYTNTRAVIPPSGVVVTDGTYVGIEGLQRFIDISWTQSNDPLLRAHKLSWSKDGGAATIESVVGQTYRINNPKQGVYKISLMAENIIGATSPTVEISYTLGELYLIESVHITNLALPSGTTAFVGKDAFFSWQTDADSVLGQSSYATGKGGQSPWFRDFEVRIYDGSTLLRTEYVTEYYYSYTFEKNIIDHGNQPKRTFTIKVQARDYYGRYSQSSQLTVSNPPPSDYGALSLTAGIQQIFVNYSQPTDPDYLQTEIYASQTAGFTPNSSNLVNTTTDRVTGFKVNATGVWYVKLRGIDVFGPVGTVYCTEVSTTVLVVDLTSEVNKVLADPGRTGDVVVEASRFLVVEPGTTTPKKAFFGIGNIDGVPTLGMSGNAIFDGSVYTRNLAAGSVSAEKIQVNQLSAISADMGTVTAGTFKTSNLNSGWRTEISDSGDFPYWYGTGAKTSANALMYMDKYGNMMYRGSLNVNNQFTVAPDGTCSIKNSSGQVIFSSGTGANWNYISGKPSDDSFKNNLIDLDWWKRDAVIPWPQNAEYNRIIAVPTDLGGFCNGPKGSSDLVWYCEETTGGGEQGGGWNNAPLILDNSKTYRFALPIRRVTGAGSSYFGIYNVCDLNTTNINTNPYFCYRSVGSPLPNDRWYLFVGYIFPYGSTGNTNKGSGIIDCKTGQFIDEGLNFNFSTSGNIVHRAYQFYASQGAAQLFGRPMVNLVDGTEPSLNSYFEPFALLNAQQTWADISGTGKPADYADVTAYNTAAAIAGQGAFATLNKVTAGNATTFIDNAAINAAQIGSIALVGTSNFSVKSGTTGARMEMDSQAIKVFDQNGVKRVQMGNLSV